MNTKCYLSFISQDLPEFLEDHLKEWMYCFVRLLDIPACRHLRANEPTQRVDIRRAECEIFTLYPQRYEEAFHPYIVSVVHKVLDLLRNVDHRAKLGTRRRGATDLVCALTKHFEVDVFDLLVRPANVCEKTPSTPWFRLWVSKGSTKRHGATSTSELFNINDHYNTHVRNDLFNIDFNLHPPILIADAINFVVLFRDHLQPEIIEIFGGAKPVALGILNSSQFILHDYLGYAFDKIYLTKRDEVPLFNSQNVPVHDYINGFRRAFQQNGANKSPYLMKGLSRAFSLMDPETALTADDHVVYLVEMIYKVIQESQDQTFVDLIFECLEIVARKAFRYVQSTIHSHLIPLIDTIIENKDDDLQSRAHQLRLLIEQAEQNSI
ncbi:hypothetical protein M3Y95_00857500 [Aphelenchoides besseyi]|nr:hypothetical protein M3Y95_00857500 [Aphelenchoides besseyi]